MDRYLLSGALLLLIFETTFLLADLGVLPQNIFFEEHVTSSAPMIGRMKRAEQNVRRRPMNSIAWEKTESRDPLWHYDAILTLANSSAEIELQDGIKLNLDEKTLVVLEPMEKSSGRSLRLKFSHGALRSRNRNSPLLFQAQTWTVEATKGSDLSLRSLENNQVEVEIKQGVATIRTEQGQAEVKSGERLTIEPDHISKPMEISSRLKWDRPHSVQPRIYSHNFPVSKEVVWEGHASKLRVIHPDRTVSTLDVPEGTQTLPLDFKTGTYHLSLIDQSEQGEVASETFSVQVWPATFIRYFNPLPRDRVRTGQDIVFSWEPVEQATSYLLEVSQDPSFNSDSVFRYAAKSTETRQTLPETGSFFWRIIGRDPEGYEIPPAYSNPLFSVPKPLEAPQLKKPQLRLPAEEKKPQSSSLLWRLIAPTAFADETTAASALEVEFEWEPVAGADHYIIEVAKDAEFQNTLLIERTTELRYLWRPSARGIVYWRVAGGAGTDQLGLFSSALRMNLDQIAREQRLPASTPEPTPTPVAAPVPKASSIPNSITTALQNRPESLHKTLERQPEPLPDTVSIRSLAPKREATPTPTPDRIVISDTAEVIPTPSIPVSSEKDAPASQTLELNGPEAKPSEPSVARASDVFLEPDDFDSRSLKVKLEWQPTYHLQRLSGQENVKGDFRGVVPLSLGLELTFEAGQKGRVHWETRGRQTKWKPEPIQDYPFQRDQSTLDAESFIFYRQVHSPHGFGLGYKHFNLITRTGPEEVTINGRNSIGPFYRHLWTLTGNLSLRLQAGLLFGTDLTNLHLEGTLTTNITRDWLNEGWCSGFIGLRASESLLFGKFGQGSGEELTAIIGVEW